MRLLRSVVDHERIAAVVATHDPVMLDVADRIIELRDGVVVGGDAIVGPPAVVPTLTGPAGPGPTAPPSRP